MVRLGSVSDPISLRMGDILVKLAERHPQVTLQMHQGLSFQVVTDVQRGDLDCGYVMSDREQAHQLIDCLPESQLSALVGLLETIVDPVAAALRNAPIDDEPESGEEKQAVAEARDWLKKNGGQGVPHGEAMGRLGLE